MKFAIALTMKRAVIGCLSAGTLAAAACSDGVEVPTSPSASAVAPSVSASAPRAGVLHVTKECSGFTGLEGSFCTITSSDVKAVEVGSRVVYLQPEGATTNSDVVLDPPGPGNNKAFGHCTVNAAGVGVCTFSRGTGKFNHFQARVDVSYLGGLDYGWSGTYSFSPGD
jgi:hypothetical protein